jgi:hypothetical protein
MIERKRLYNQVEKFIKEAFIAEGNKAFVEEGQAAVDVIWQQASTYWKGKGLIDPKTSLTMRDCFEYMVWMDGAGFNEGALEIFGYLRYFPEKHPIANQKDAVFYYWMLGALTEVYVWNKLSQWPEQDRPKNVTPVIEKMTTPSIAYFKKRRKKLKK